MKKSIAILLMFCAFSATQPAASQPVQTPENAHRFLAIALKDLSVEYFARGDAKGRVESYAKSTNCSAVVTGPVRLITGPYARPVVTDLASGRMFTLNYSEITDITVDSARRKIVIKLKSANSPAELTITNVGQDLADRINYAMQFLMDTCDPTAGLGF